MVRFVVARFLQSLAVLWLVYTGTYWLLLASPGNPFAGDRNLPPAVLASLEARYGLDNPLKTYFTYAGQVLLHGDMGTSISYQDWSVGEIIARALPVSVALGALALIMALWAGVAIGTWGALRQGRPSDMVLTVLTLFGVSLPTFVIGTLLLLLFAVVWPIFPAGGWGTIRQMILPALTLALFFVAYISRLTRVSVLDTLGADYVRTARAKGLPRRTVIGRHVLGNAALPVLTYLGPAAAYALTGSFVVEKIFAIRGLGTHFVNACLNKDIPLVLGVVLTYTAVVVVFSFLVDLAYAAVDPRISLT